MDYDKTEESSVQIFVPCERSFSLVFREEEWLVGVTPSTWNLGSTGPIGAKSSVFNQYSLV